MARAPKRRFTITATVYYYKGIIDAFKDDSGGLNYPEIIIYSLNLGKLLGFMQSGNYNGEIVYLADAIARLKDAGADFAAITANTPHIFLMKSVKVPDCC